MDIRKVTITPKMAKEWLAKNTANRPINTKLVTRYVKEIKNDNWRMTRDTIKISTSGNLIDGQHRLRAIVVAEQAMMTMVAYDVEDNCFGVIDTGKKRSHADVLSIEGFKHTTNLAAALRLKHAIDVTKTPKTLEPIRNASMSVSNTDILGLVERYPDMQDAVTMAKEYPYASVLLTMSAAVICAHDFTKIDRNLARLFFEKLETGAELSGNSPLLQLRNGIIQLRNTPGLRRLTAFFGIATAFQAWNYLIEGNVPPTSKWVTASPEIVILSKPKKSVYVIN